MKLYLMFILSLFEIENNQVQILLILLLSDHQLLVS